MNKFTSRRTFLLGSATLLTGSGFILAGWPSRAKHKQPLSPARISLRSIIDTIVPADDTPGALDLKVDDVITNKMQRQPKIDTVVMRLLSAVDKNALSQHQQVFSALNIDQRETLLLEMLQPGTPQRARFDLQRVRQETVKAYYTTTEGQAAINYLAPNQFPFYISTA